MFTLTQERPCPRDATRRVFDCHCRQPQRCRFATHRPPSTSRLVPRRPLLPSAHLPPLFLRSSECRGVCDTLRPFAVAFLECGGPLRGFRARSSATGTRCVVCIPDGSAGRRFASIAQRLRGAPFAPALPRSRQTQRIFRSARRRFATHRSPSTSRLVPRRPSHARRKL